MPPPRPRQPHPANRRRQAVSSGPRRNARRQRVERLVVEHPQLVQDSCEAIGVVDEVGQVQVAGQLSPNPRRNGRPRAQRPEGVLDVVALLSRQRTGLANRRRATSARAKSGRAAKLAKARWYFVPSSSAEASADRAPRRRRPIGCGGRLAQLEFKVRPSDVIPRDHERSPSLIIRSRDRGKITTK